MATISEFTEAFPTNETYWRSIILFGRNVASYKFALANSLLELAEGNKTQITAEELAVPFAKHICSHLQQVDKQGTSSSSQFLDACRDYNEQKISYDKLISTTAQLGFNNVLDAFHVVNNESLPLAYFKKLGKSNSSGIILTDEVYKLKALKYDKNLDAEVEARWRLVETAWENNISRSTLQVEHDLATGLLVVQQAGVRRKSITSVRTALNGYQKGKCFYCFDDINISDDAENTCDVDHFFPHSLQIYNPKVNLNGVWNLVLTCKFCNRGQDGKMARIPAIHYLSRLNKRNNFLINSHHPLRETIMAQTGITDEERQFFLASMDRFAIEHSSIRWETTPVQEATF